MTIRPAREEDLPGVVAVMNAFDVATLGEPDSIEEDVAAGWAESSFDLALDAFVDEREGRIIGYAEVYDRGHGGQLDVDVFCHPEYQADAAPALLDAAIARAYRRSGGQTTLATWVPDGRPLAEIYAAAGFRPVRAFQRMRATLDDSVEPPAPVPGVDIRGLGDGEERVVYQVLHEAFARHVRPIAPSLEQFVEQHVNHSQYEPELWAVAWDGDRAVGAVTVFDDGDLGFIRHVGVLPTARRRGIAGALVRRAMWLLSQRGRDRVDLGVDVDDEVGAARLYEHVGFRPVQRLVLVERAPAS